MPTHVIAGSASVADNDAERVEQVYADLVGSLGMRWPRAQRSAATYTHQAWFYELALDGPASEADARAFEQALRDALQRKGLPMGQLRVQIAPPKRLLSGR